MTARQAQSPQPALFSPPLRVPPGTAVFSADRTHRYRLDRTLGPGPAVLWVMLNPSTADTSRNDPTVRRVLGFSRVWGFGRVAICNLHSLRATDPRALDGVVDYTSHLGDDYLRAARADAAQVVVGWGSLGIRWPRRVAHVCSLLGPDLWCLGRTARGTQPRHPLYVAGHVPLQRWTAPEVTP